jgi:hypothetical protein
MLATTPDGLLDQLEIILRRSIAAGDRRGYFAALYDRVTRRVRDGVARGEFEDGPRMERFDVLFANRYFEAYDLEDAGARPTLPWAVAFDAAKGEGLFVVQHLLLGMIAHIVYDLGLALADFASGPALAAMRNDYLHINDLLAEEVGVVEDELVAIAGRWQPDAEVLLRLAEGAAHGAERSAARLAMEKARAQAWDFAVRLIDATDPAARRVVIERQELAAVAMAETVRVGAPAGALIARDRGDDVAANVRVLARGAWAPETGAAGA